MTNNQREITYDKVHLLASRNVERLAADTSPNTKKHYFKRFSGLYRRYQSGFEGSTYQILDAIIDKMVAKRQTGQIQYSSLRQYKAALMYGLTMMAAFKQNSSLVPTTQSFFFEDLAQDLSLAQIDQLSTKVLLWKDEDNGQLRQLNSQAKSLEQTSTAKMKNLPVLVYKTIMQQPYKKPREILFQHFVYYNVIFGLRPVEWFSASLHLKSEIDGEMATHYSKTAVKNLLLINQEYKQQRRSPALLLDKGLVSEGLVELGLADRAPELLLVKTDETKTQTGSLTYVLKVKNAKASHGRSCGEYRYLIFDCDALFAKNLGNFISSLQSLVSKTDRTVFNTSFDLEPSRIKSPEQVLESFKRLMRKINKKKRIATYLNKLYKSRLKTYQANQANSLKKGRQVLADPPIRLVPTLYSTRHQAIANSKALGLSEYQIAALFGHVSPYTADRHYGRAYYGGKVGIRPKPSDHNLNIILESVNESKIQALTALYAEDLGLPTPSVDVETALEEVAKPQLEQERPKEPSFEQTSDKKAALSNKSMASDDFDFGL